MVTIVFMDDEPKFIKGYASALDADGYDVKVVTTSRALKEAFDEPVDIAILDVNLLSAIVIERQKAQAAEENVAVFIQEEGEGYRVLQWIKQNSPTTGVVMLTSQKTDLYDRIRGLDEGADDYIQKGMEVLEFRSRIRSLVRRLFPNAPEKFKISDLSFDARNGRLSSNSGSSVVFTKAEAKLLESLCLKRGETLSRTDLYRAVFDADSPGKGDRAVDNLVSKVRAKVQTHLGYDMPISTMYGTGYRLYA